MNESLRELREKCQAAPWRKVVIDTETTEYVLKYFLLIKKLPSKM